MLIFRNWTVCAGLIGRNIVDGQTDVDISDNSVLTEFMEEVLIGKGVVIEQTNRFLCKAGESFKSEKRK